jgi:hypothetical protein
MKPRFYAIALAVLCTLVAPATFAQRAPADIDNGQVGPLPTIPGAGSISRTFTTAVLTTPDGTPIGKAKAASITTPSRSLQALRIAVNGLTPNTEYAVVVDNTLVGTASTNAQGILKLRLSDPPGRNGQPLPEAIRPVTQVATISLYEVASQRLVATGQFRTGGSPK